MTLRKTWKKNNDKIPLLEKYFQKPLDKPRKMSYNYHVTEEGRLKRMISTESIEGFEDFQETFAKVS